MSFPYNNYEEHNEKKCVLRLAQRLLSVFILSSTDPNAIALMHKHNVQHEFFSLLALSN